MLTLASKVLVLISTGEKNKALTGLAYAARAIQQGWHSDVKVGFFGPSEALLADDPEVQEAVSQLRGHAIPFACKAIADRAGISERLVTLGLDVHYVGETISGYIKDDYVPMVF